MAIPLVTDRHLDGTGRAVITQRAGNPTGYRASCSAETTAREVFVRRLTTTGIVVAGAALPLLLGACQSSATGASEPSTPSSSTGPTTVATSAEAAGSGAGQASSTSVPRCHTADLSASLGAKQGSGQVTVPLVYTNTSGHTCTLDGFGGVDLHGPNDATFGPVYSLPRESATPKLVRLAPGASAHVPITYLVGDASPGPDVGNWLPTTVVATPPDETTQLTVPWTMGDTVERQDAATHPGTYIGPVTEGAS
ncbi:MAG TPA: DUF4232 domain-containing protein [Amycolatopsis sp.]|nr:DUF4232 domain-containing protein [Amycolatopsis sp.]